MTTSAWKLPLNLDGKHNAGNKTLGLTGIKRLRHFADWASKQPEGQARRRALRLDVSFRHAMRRDHS